MQGEDSVNKNTDDGNLFFELVQLSTESDGRKVCESCSRPASVCWCLFLPKEPISSKCKVIILQHPAERKRSLRTVPMLVKGMAPNACQVFVGKKFPVPRHHGLAEILSSPDAVLLFPGSDSKSLVTMASVSDRARGYILIMVDGTWAQAKAILANSPFLDRLPQVYVESSSVSAYIIRTQPHSRCFSTLEAAAIALSMLEQNPEVWEHLTRPLSALCRFQLEHGAEKHDRYINVDTVGKRNKRLLTRIT